MKTSDAKPVALGGMLAALAVVLMCLGGMIPVATYVCPMGSCLILFFVLHACGRRIAWAWYGAVAILSLLLGPDKEAAVLFAAIGYYPVLKPVLEKFRFALLWKVLLFNGVIFLVYGLLMRLLGMDAVLEEYALLGKLGLAIMLVLGNVTFLLLDVVLARLHARWKKR